MTEYAKPDEVTPAYAKPEDVTPIATKRATTPEIGLLDAFTPAKLKTLPAALRDVVQRQIQVGDPSVLSIPAVQPILMDFLKTHPELAKWAGGVGGAILGTPGGPGGMIAGGAAGASVMDSASQLTEMGTPAAPTSAKDALLRSASAAGEGALTGALPAGGVAGAPKVLRFVASPAGGALIAGGTTLYKTGDPYKAAIVAGSTAAGMKVLPGISSAAGKLADRMAISPTLEQAAPEAVAGLRRAYAENLALNARVAHTLTREAPEAVSAIEKTILESGASPATARGVAAAESAKAASAIGEPMSGNLPGVVTPKVPLPAIAMAEQIRAQVTTLKAAGLSNAQVAAAVRETHQIPLDTAKDVVQKIVDAQGKAIEATTTVLPAGRKVMPSPRGGPAQPSMGPARVPQSDEDLMGLLQGSLEAYRMP